MSSSFFVFRVFYRGALVNPERLPTLDLNLSERALLILPAELWTSPIARDLILSIWSKMTPWKTLVKK